MDTRFWGPSGWKLIHLSAVTYTPDKRSVFNEWLSTLPYILPCKFCRASLISYYEELPPDYTSNKTLSKWLWKIHGKVNDKLRRQGQTIPKDPPFAAVYNKYWRLSNNLDVGCKRECTELEKDILDKDGKCITVEKYCSDQIWDFLFATAFQHPRSTKSSPMTDAPSHIHACDLSDPDKCRWNLMEPLEKMPYFRKFWSTLPGIFPDDFRSKWLRALYHNPMRVENKHQTLKWLYNQYRNIYHGKVRPFPAVLRELEMHSSDCNKSKRARTCRRKPGRAIRKTVKNH
jgi:hypothetical protein